MLTIPTWETVRVAPLVEADIGEYTITLNISDTLDNVTATFMISVYNTPPYFLNNIPFP